MTVSPRHVLRVGALLGEGPVWDRTRACLWFVDIRGKRAYRFDPVAKKLTGWDAPRAIGWLLPATDGSLIAGLQGLIARFDPATGQFDPWLEVEPHLPGNRLNDATVDPAGSLWFGTMDDAERRATGRLYRLSAVGVRDSGFAPVTVTNGPGFSPDGRTIYHTDTLGGVIFAASVTEDGALAEPRIFARIDPEDGYPDGISVDSEGNVWSGLFAGWGVRCFSPDGTLRRTVRLPVANITKIAFGGPDLRTAYVTTARQGLSAAELAEQPLAGDLFAFRTEIAGLPIPALRWQPK